MLTTGSRDEPNIVTDITIRNSDCQDA